MREFVYLKNEMIVYGQAELFDDDVLFEDLPENFNRISISNIKVIQLDLKRNEVLIKCNNRSEYLINVDREQSLIQLKNDVIAAYPKKAEVLDENSTLFYLIRKPIVAIFVIFILLIIVGAAGKNGYKSGASMNVNAVTNVVNGMSALKTKKLVMIFAVLFSLPISRIFWLFRNVNRKTVIRLQ